MKKHYLLLTVIVMLASLLRFYALGDVPAGLHRDEAFLGYNAYSILKTGRDINGNFLPIHLESFLYSPAGYSYFSIPFIALFNLSAFSTRFASAFFGSLTVLVLYLLVFELFRKSQIALISSFLLAISPWHINLSHTATENVIAVFFIVIGIYLYIKSLRSKNTLFLILSFLSFVTTFFLYQAPRVFLPFLIPLLYLIFKNVQRGKRRTFLFFSLYVFLIILPLVLILTSRNLSLRIRTLSIFNTRQTQLVIDEQIREDGVENFPFTLSRIFHNKAVGYSLQFLENYFKHFSYDFLFTDRSLPDRYRVPLVGIVYIAELPFLLFGIWKMLQTEKKIGVFLLGWVLISPIGSALTFDDVPNLQRTLLAAPAFSIFSAYGVYILILSFKKRYVNLLTTGISILFLMNFLFYFHQYYIHVNRYRPWYRNDGYKQLVNEVNKLLPNYNLAVITNRESAPTIFFLFYSLYDPSLFQKETKNSKLRDFDRVGFGKYEFSEEECPLEVKQNNRQSILLGEKGKLYINSGLCKEDTKTTSVLGSIKRVDNSEVFHIVKVLD